MNSLKLRQLATMGSAIGLSISLSSCASFHTPTSRSLSSSLNEYHQLAEPDEKRILASAGVHSPTTQSYLFDWPVDDARLTRGYLPHKRGRPHLGLDLAAPRGTPILASKKGTVIYTGREFKGFGKMVMIESGDGWATLYAHLDNIFVAEGQVVTMGEVIGAMGRTGRATGVHLHFEIRKISGPVDPLPLLPNGEEIARKIALNPRLEQAIERM